MTYLSFGVWVCIPFVWLVLLLPYVKWEIQVQFIKKKSSREFKNKKEFFWTMYGYSILQTLEKIDQDESLEIQKTGHFYVHS